MDKLKNLLNSGNKRGSQQALKAGSYSLAVTAVVLAIIIVVNIFASALPSSMTKLDISSSKLYSITSNTKVVVNALDEDVTIYWVVQSGAENDVIENLLSKYESLSDHIQVVKKNPDVYPTFTQQYTDETVANNSLIVECGDKNRYISLEDIYPGEVNMHTGTYDATEFDGEGCITSAIDYVTTEELPQLYLLEGHGEAELPSIFREQIEKENIEINTLSLLTVDEIPEEADCLMIYAPESDISEAERDMLADYIADGGKLMVSAGPTEDGTLENLYGLLKNYGVEAAEGIVVESDRNYYFQNPQLLLPNIESSTLTDYLIEDNYYVMMPVAQGLTSDGYSAGGTVTELLTTSYMAFSKAAGFELSTYEYEEGDVEGPFALAVSIEDNSGGGLVWFASSLFLEDSYNSFSSGANGDLGMNALSSLIGETESMAIRSKSLNYNYLTISEEVSSLLKVLMIGVFPLAYLGVGICVILNRKKVQNEAV